MLTSATVSIFLVLLFNGITTQAQDSSYVIGAIIDVNTRIGKEESIAMEIAIQTLNNASGSSKNEILLHVNNSGGNPLQASMAAEELIREKKVEAVVGMETWQEAAWVAEVASRAQVPVLSFVAPSITPPLTWARWPYLVRMATNDSLQIQCIAAIVGSYEWRKVIAIYEDETYTSDLGVEALLLDALIGVGSQIEHRLALPPLYTLSDPKAFIREELVKLSSTQSRVFIVVRSSIELATHIFVEANDLGLMGDDSVWITTDTVASLLGTLNSTVMSSMQGLIGIKAHFSETNPSFNDFSIAFRNLFRSTYPQEPRSAPGSYALRAYDTIFTVASAIEKSSNRSRIVLDNILSSNFNGLSGKIQFKDGELWRKTSYEIVNVVGSSYVRLKFWSSEYGFSNSIGGGGCASTEVLGGRVYWPGGVERVPLGWVMPSEANPMLIGVPREASFEKFVRVIDGQEPTGFCIEVFKSALSLLNYDIPYKFVPYAGLYGDLMKQVYHQHFSAAVGDITILGDRLKHVEFTQPYAESSLTMVVPVKPHENAWLIVKPFTTNLWIVVIVLFLYTMFAVGFIENSANPNLRGPRRNFGSAMWLTSFSLFFAHKEKFHSNFTRVVMFVWLFTVFVVMSSFTASLTSMLTVQLLEPSVTDIETLKINNSPVGCSRNSFIGKYLVKVQGFSQDQIIDIWTEQEFREALEDGKIKAAFMELPYARVFLSRNSTKYIDAGFRHRFGGLGFAFPRGSPLAIDFSEAFLKLEKNGMLDTMDKGWLGLYSPCPDNKVTNKRLDLDSFWALFMITGLTSTLVLLLYIIKSKYAHLDDTIRRVQSHESPCEQTSIQVTNDPQLQAITETEMADISIWDLDKRQKVLRLASSFPGPGGRSHFSSNGWEHIPKDS